MYENEVSREIMKLGPMYENNVSTKIKHMFHAKYRQFTALKTINPLCPSVTNSSRITKFSILIKEGSIKKKFL